MISRETELQLLHKAQAGDQRAFGKLVEENYRQLWAVALRVSGNKHDAEDALQNALIAAWQNIERFDGKAKFTTWAHRIVTNAALQIHRRRRDTVDADAGIDEQSRDAPIDQTIADRSAVGQALATLSPEFREAIVLREYGGLSYQEIAEEQGVGIQTVKSRINRARSKLREQLEPVLR